jgi:hypothetical protein
MNTKHTAIMFVMLLSLACPRRPSLNPPPVDLLTTTESLRELLSNTLQVPCSCAIEAMCEHLWCI